MAKRLVVLGGGESGAGAAVLAKVKGMDVWLSDAGNIGQTYKDMLDKYDIAWEEGGHTPEKILNADEIVKSPGIPDTAPMVAQAIEKGIPIVSEIRIERKLHGLGYGNRTKSVCWLKLCPWTAHQPEIKKHIIQ